MFLNKSTSYCSHIRNHHPKDILSIDDFLKIRSQVLNKNVNYQDEEDDVTFDEALQIGESGDVDAPPGMMGAVVSDIDLQIPNLFCSCSSCMYL